METETCQICHGEGRASAYDRLNWTGPRPSAAFNRKDPCPVCASTGRTLKGLTDDPA